ncbi:MAG TPA: thiamine pyrophosphate-dependent dehydrogenase E1 component subunit alpha [Gaiellaceae bacterium]|nr:thiamine pyrophosphate-dependent dehydrogenase E1 component subunit alpha [Gaiellaceae bacterium]
MAATETREDVQALEALLLRMWQIRAFEVRAMELFEENLIRGSVHPYVGMEAIAVGACAALGPEDFITSTHRGHGHCIAKGLDLKLMMAEIIGREDGYCRGRGGSMHITAIDKGMLGADAIVAGSSAIAVGAAHGLRLQGRDGVVLCFFGDGAANQGILHEACNLGAVLSAPAVFICENNEWAISTPAAASTRIANIADRAAGYGIPGAVVDGNDVLGVRAVTTEAVARARAGDGPTLIEAKSYRVTPHSAATKTDLRPVEELDAWRARDPILRFSRHLAEEHGVELARLEQIEEQARRDVEEAVEFALASPRPEPEAALEDVYAPADWLTPGRLS